MEPTKDVVAAEKPVNGEAESYPSPSSSDMMSDAVLAPLSVCLACGKQDRSVEFILPDFYCSQSCADKHGRSGKKGTHKFPGKHSRRGRKKGKLSLLKGSDGVKEMSLAGYQSAIDAPTAFNWLKFMAEKELQAAPENLFLREPQNSSTNEFKVGMKLEGIDPSHPSLYCVLSVAEVKGYRIRLHFDGHPECHDFWTNANSDEMFPVGWCKEMGKKLQAPKGIQNDQFCWESYLNTSHAAAPYASFRVCTKEFVAKKPAFGIGDKLEAVDIKNKNTYICVATVADTYADKLLVHFDGWEDNYDYWCYYNSAHIHHVGWCQENLKTLSAPNGYVDPSIFTWDSYLEETKSKAAPLDGFAPVVEHEFKAKMALEAVDKRNPSLVRVAEVVKVTETGLFIHFCGWNSKYDYWEDADSPDLHPAGWCEKTGHPLQPPLTSLDVLNYMGTCPTIGCYGLGHVKGAKFASHYRLAGCPYADIYLNRDGIIPERVMKKFAAAPQSALPSEVSNNHEEDDVSQTTTAPRRKRGSSIRGGRTKHCRKESMEVEQFVDEDIKPEKPNTSSHYRSSPPSTSAALQPLPQLLPQPLAQPQPQPQPQPPTLPPALPPTLPRRNASAAFQDLIYDSVFQPAAPARRVQQLPYGWEVHVRLLPGIREVPYSQVPSWSSEQVADLMRTLSPTFSEEQRQRVIDNRIDGEAFLLMNQSDLTSILDLKLGPALKIYNGMLLIKKALGSL